MGDGFSLGDGPYHFFERSSFSAALSSIDSARSFFSLRFSSSSAFSRLASETSSPPYLAFQLYSVASETPYLRARSAALAPASCSPQNRDDLLFRKPLPLHRPSLQQGRTLTRAWRKSSVAGQLH